MMPNATCVCGTCSYFHRHHLSSVFFFVVLAPIHWVNAYANASGCLRGLERVPTPEVFYIICLRGCLRRVLCWMVMVLVNEDCIFELCSIFELLTFISQFRQPNTAIRLILTIWVTACWADSCGRGFGQRASK